ncbi:TetR/AcrR family transcriptional regulator [Archangium lansingense]|uniref:TetR/AcrR family transcriptional regulator n=1 Tax=Archangium lansingense TaxID=2995310 RepID=A0ABT4ABZ8_9BACT|nr:TetR/AcrR family transcriptional regulator [Archangium lansinium]MCY1079106.1 TetR/AcrR family transcriptional regulator [Archangium lansinium]
MKERGVQGAGVDGIARRVGLTGAALYTHFESKQDFLCTVLREELGTSARRFLSADVTLDEALARYLSLAHVRNPAAGCALPAITSEVGRSDEEVRQAFEAGLAEVVRALGEKLGSHDEAPGVLAAALGAVALARALPDDASALAVLESARALITSALQANASSRRQRRAKPSAGSGDE